MSGVALPYAGGVILTRADRHDIRSLNDIRNLIIAAESPKSFTGLQVQWREMKDANVEMMLSAKQVGDIPLHPIELPV